MKYLLLLTVFIVGAGAAYAQSSKQVRWTFTAKKLNETTYEVHMNAQINGNWHMYAQQAGEGPVSTSFEFVKNPLVSFDGQVKEVGKLKKVHEEAFGSEVKFYENQVDFIQVVKLKGKVKTNIAGKVEFMVCDDKQCLPPATVDFKVPVGG
jgi:hypothetical protein